MTLNSIECRTVSWGCRICRLYPCRRARHPTTRPLVGYEWRLIILEDGLLVTEQSVVQEPNKSCDLQHHFGSYWARRAVGEAWPDKSVGHVKPLYLNDCPDRIFQNDLVANKYRTLFPRRGDRRWWLRINCAKIAIF